MVSRSLFSHNVVYFSRMWHCVQWWRVGEGYRRVSTEKRVLVTTDKADVFKVSQKMNYLTFPEKRIPPPKKKIEETTHDRKLFLKEIVFQRKLPLLEKSVLWIYVN